MTARSAICSTCRTGSASLYIRHRAESRGRCNLEKVRAHAPGCPGLPERTDGPDITLWCEGCDLRRTGPRWRAALSEHHLHCPRCAGTTAHHESPREIVEAGLCLCGSCRLDRFFAEATIAEAEQHKRYARIVFRWAPRPAPELVERPPQPPGCPHPCLLRCGHCGGPFCTRCAWHPELRRRTCGGVIDGVALQVQTLLLGVA